MRLHLKAADRSRAIPGRIKLAVLVALACLAASAAAVIAKDTQPGTFDAASPNDVRDARPGQTEPVVVATGETRYGASYAVLVSTGDGLDCVATHFDDPPPEGKAAGDSAAPDGVPGMRVRGSRFCTKFRANEIAASMPQAFTDPRTGQYSDTPLRFVYGMAGPETESVLVRGPEGQTDRLEVSRGQNGRVVFAGSAVGHERGEGSVTAYDATGEALAVHELIFAGPQHTSDEEAKESYDLHPDELAP